MLLEKLEEALRDLELTKRDAEKADAGNKSAGVRLRKDLKKVQDKLQELRKLVLTLREED
jgi:hypothetical protein